MSAIIPAWSHNAAIGGSSGGLDYEAAKQSVEADKVPWSVDFFDAIERTIFSSYRLAGVCVVDLANERFSKLYATLHAVEQMVREGMAGEVFKCTLRAASGGPKCQWRVSAENGADISPSVVLPSADGFGAAVRGVLVPKVVSLSARDIMQGVAGAFATGGDVVAVCEQVSSTIVMLHGTLAVDVTQQPSGALSDVWGFRWGPQ